MRVLFLSLLLVLSTTACRGVNWPAMVSCGVQPAPSLIDGAINALRTGGDTKQKMEALALQYGAEAVICVMRSLVMQSEGFAGATQPLTSNEAARARAFLREVGH